MTSPTLTCFLSMTGLKPPVFSGPRLWPESRPLATGSERQAATGLVFNGVRTSLGVAGVRRLHAELPGGGRLWSRCGGWCSGQRGWIPMFVSLAIHKAPHVEPGAGVLHAGLAGHIVFLRTHYYHIVTLRK